MEELINEYKCMISAYYGVKSMDEYELKEYILKDIEEYIINFISINKIDNFNYGEEAKLVEDKVSLVTKLQDSLIILSRINGPLDLILLIRKKIKKIKE